MCEYDFLPWNISDEPLDPGPAQEALVVYCIICAPGSISDEALDQAPAQEAYVGCRVCVLCTISDEALDAR